jgi:RHS repeat-associated protein
LPTDHRFTGQRWEQGLGLYDYNARWYHPALGRFVSADTFVLNPNDPQSLNRYAYVRGNPLRYVDPTGHFIQCTSDGTCYDDGHSVSNPGFTSYGADERRNALVEYNNKLYGWVRKGYTYDGRAITDLVALAELSDYAASMIPTDMGDRASVFAYDIASVLTKQVSGVGGKYYDRTRPLQQTGFDWVFQDPGAGGNQPHHFWFYVYQAMANGRGVAVLGNYAHETFLCRYSRKAKGFVGRSYQDYALGDMGGRLGSALRNGDIGIEDTGNWIRTTLSPGGGGANYWNGAHPSAEFEKRFYALSLAIAGATIFSIGEGQQGR